MILFILIDSIQDWTVYLVIILIWWPAFRVDVWADDLFDGRPNLLDCPPNWGLSIWTGVWLDDQFDNWLGSLIYYLNLELIIWVDV